MKRKYADTLRSSSAMSDPEGPAPLTQAEERIIRTETLLREANRDRIREYQDRDTRKQAIYLEAGRKAAREAGKAHSIHEVRVTEMEDGTIKTTLVVSKEASPAIIELMDNPQSLITGLMWDGMKTPERVVMLDQLGFKSDLVFAPSVLDILPEKSKAYVLGWQKQINSGAAWSGSLSVGSRAEHLMEQGYLLQGKEGHHGDFVMLRGRDGIEGLPGSASFVRAMMGQAYLDWLLANEEHPIEV